MIKEEINIQCAKKIKFNNKNRVNLGAFKINLKKNSVTL